MSKHREAGRTTINTETWRERKRERKRKMSVDGAREEQGVREKQGDRSWEGQCDKQKRGRGESSSV